MINFLLSHKIFFSNNFFSHAIFVMNFDLSSFDLTQQQQHHQRSISIEIVLKRKRLRYYMKRSVSTKEGFGNEPRLSSSTSWLHHQGRPERCIERKLIEETILSRFFFMSFKAAATRYTIITREQYFWHLPKVEISEKNFLFHTLAKK